MSTQPYPGAGSAYVKNLKFSGSFDIKILIKAANKVFIKKYQDMIVR